MYMELDSREQILSVPSVIISDLHRLSRLFPKYVIADVLRSEYDNTVGVCPYLVSYLKKDFFAVFLPHLPG